MQVHCDLGEFIGVAAGIPDCEAMYVQDDCRQELLDDNTSPLKCLLDAQRTLQELVGVFLANYEKREIPNEAE